jgi:hypothetical protein
MAAVMEIAGADRPGGSSMTKMRWIALGLVLSALITASAAHAAPLRLRASEAAAEAGLLAGAWEWLVSLLTGGSPGDRNHLTFLGSGDTSHLDPNGGD